MRVKRGEKGAASALEMLAEPTRFLSTVQIGITAIGILTGLFSGAQVSTVLTEWIAGVPALAPYASTIAVTVVVLIVTYLTLVIGELIPKRLGLANPEGIASVAAWPMSLLSKISKPFVNLLSWSTELVFRVFNINYITLSS